MYGRHAVMPNDVALAPLISLPHDQLTYAQDLILRLTKAHEVFSTITKELKQKRREYYDLTRKFQASMWVITF